jgi:hypothetical protein
VVNTVGPIITEAWVENENGEFRFLFEGGCDFLHLCEQFPRLYSPEYPDKKPVSHRLLVLSFYSLANKNPGNALADVVFGDVNPSGRLPYTIGKDIKDFAAEIIYEDYTDSILQIPYDESIFVDYRHFDQVFSLVLLASPMTDNRLLIGSGWDRASF